MIMEDDSVEEADIVVLPPVEVDQLSDCEAEHVDDNDLTTNDVLPDDVAGAVEVQSTFALDDSSEAKPRSKRQQQ